MIIKEYQDTYLDEVIGLFVEEYDVKFNDYKRLFIKFFEHPFQKNKCIRIIAIDGSGQLLGFQSFFYWPYTKAGKLYTVYQSGSSIVSKQARGKGVFQKMLNYIDTVKDKYSIDFLVGFPVEASYKSFMSNGWNNPFNLQWFMKVKNPLGFLFSFLYRNRKDLSLSGPFDSGVFRMENAKSFMDWRSHFQKDTYRVFTYQEGNDILEINHKLNKRKRIFNELIIGEILCHSKDPVFLNQAFHKYRRWLFFQFDISLVSFATNDEFHPLSERIIARGLKKIDKQIFFITKYAPETHAADWLLFRSDIDTW
jgi:hypothetical protein